MTPVEAALLFAIGGVLALIGGPLMLRNASKLALPPNQKFNEERWFMGGILFTVGGAIAVLLAVAIFVRLASGGHITMR